MAMEFELSGPDVNFIESHNAIAGWLASRKKKLPLKGRKRKKEGSLLEKRDSLDRRRVKRIMFFMALYFTQVGLGLIQIFLFIFESYISSKKAVFLSRLLLRKVQFLMIDNFPEEKKRAFNSFLIKRTN